MKKVKKSKVKEVSTPAVKINLEDFVRKLKEVEAGLSSREILDQSNCFVFPGDGTVCTFNDEIACRNKVALPKQFRGAIQAPKLTELLGEVKQTEVKVQMVGGEFVVTGKGESFGVRMEADVLLPIDSIEAPDDWQEIHEDFSDAVGIVQECASKDANSVFSSLHIHPKWIEACDNFQMTRYWMATGFKHPVMVKKNSLKHVSSFDLTEFSESDSWVHFRNPNGLTLSCRRYTGKFPKLSTYLQVEGEPAVLPSALGEAMKKANIVTKENEESDQVRIEIRPGIMRVFGTGPSAWYKAKRKMKYTGRAMSFLVAPKLMQELVRRHTKCEISKDHKLKVNGGKFVYVCSLEKVSDQKEG